MRLVDLSSCHYGDSSLFSTCQFLSQASTSEDSNIVVRLEMSRLTTAQVINLGEYLEPEFDPTSLTNPQLLGVLGYHNVHYPTPYTKPKLVQIFNDEIKAKADKLKKERLKKENSLASDEGIIDGHSGQPLKGGSKVELIHSRSGIS